jgi:glycosyltransferase involved in cell wall biosynthesis
MLISLTRAKTVKKNIANLIKGESLDTRLVMYSYWCDDVALGLAMANKEYPHLKTICRIHRWDVYFEESKVNYLPFRHFIVENISKIFSISTDGVNYAQKNWKVGIQDKFCVSRLGVSNKQPFQIPVKDTFLIVSCSNIIPIKRVNLIAKALKYITATPIKWVHIGDGPERNKLEAFIQELPCNIQVELLGRLSNSNVKRYYAKNLPDLFINVSTSEGVPVSIMEAMSFGIPVIATNIGGNNEIVSAENGYLLPSQLLPEDLANSIKSFLDLSSEQKEVKRYLCYETWRNYYSAEINFREFVKSFQDL